MKTVLVVVCAVVVAGALGAITANAWAKSWMDRIDWQIQPT